MTTIHGPDPIRGHISIRDEQLMPLAVLCDLGPFLDMWTYKTVHLTPDVARELGTALTAWADWHHANTVRDTTDPREMIAVLTEALDGDAA